LRYISRMNDVVRSYADLPVHKVIGELIQRHSENKRDIRQVAQSLVDWRGVHTILDCGCGYGWFEKSLEGPFDKMIGVDCLEENRAAFLAAAQRIATEAVFRNLLLPAPLDLPADQFDCVVSAYSLYFFPDMVGEIKRVLRPGGTFLIVTHSESMLEEGEHFFDFRNLKKIIRGFSSENGEDLLSRHFSRITMVDYSNALVFDRKSGEDLSLYIDFKKEFISKDVAPEIVKDTMLRELRRRGALRFNKNDRIFVVQK
jgi:SAM-dependent methyltransferase